MNSDTPALSIRSADLGKNAAALRKLIRLLRPSTIRTVLDIRYGLGGWARECLARFPATSYSGLEADPDTWAAAWKDSPRLTVSNTRFDPTEYRPGGATDLLLADFNTATVLKRREVDEAISTVRPRHAVFTDVACVKLHLNYRAYGLAEPSLEEYWERFRVEGYRLRRFARVHHAASTALFDREGD